jgi:hypothetical protein
MNCFLEKALMSFFSAGQTEKKDKKQIAQDQRISNPPEAIRDKKVHQTTDPHKRQTIKQKR